MLAEGFVTVDLLMLSSWLWLWLWLWLLLQRLV